MAKTSVIANLHGKVSQFNQSATGSLLYDGKTNYLAVSNRSSIGKGGIVIIPFLDVNCNGIHEKGEPRVTGINIKLSGGRIKKDNSDSTIRIFDLEPYTSYLLELDRNNLENIAWQLKKKTYSVVIEPNNMKLVEIPVVVYGEVNGEVFLNKNGSQKGQGRISVCFFRDTTLVAKVLTDPDGFFSYLGFPPGIYTARIDTAQLKIIQMVSKPALLKFTVLGKREGDLIEGLDFVLSTSSKPAPTNSTTPIPEESITPIKPEGSTITGETEVSTTPGKPGGLTTTFAIQIGAFGRKNNAREAQKKLQQVVKQPVVIIEEGNIFKVRITGYPSRVTAQAVLPVLEKAGFIKVFIIEVK
ncbi:MAG: SPOR domain-containing protein [Bacteroidetes bacterium]|nr:SPOR domain-containing protein [Bacteroidota bacterium]